MARTRICAYEGPLDDGPGGHTASRGMWSFKPRPELGEEGLCLPHIKTFS